MSPNPHTTAPERRVGAAHALATLCCALLAAGSAGATTADNLCDPTDDPCLVTKPVVVTPDSLIDVGSRALVIANGGILDLTSGTMTLNAATLTVAAGGRFDAAGTAGAAGGTIIATAGAITVTGAIVVRGAPGGMVTLTSTGPLTVAGSVEARSTARGSAGGSVTFVGAAVTINGSVDASGGAEESGGEITVRASDTVQVTGSVNATGGDGGGIDITGSAAITLGPASTLRADASASGGNGGDIDVDADGEVRVEGELTAVGRDGTVDDGGGDGGVVAVSGRSFSGARAAARIAVTAGTPDGVGGDIELSTAAGALTYSGRLEAQSPGTEGNAGSVTVDADGAATLSGVINATGGRGGGGDVDVTTGGDLRVASTASITTAAISSGEGGRITLFSSAGLDIDGALLSDGGPAPGGTGGSIALTACVVRVNTGGRLNSLRTGGRNTCIGRDRTIVAGTLRADTLSGFNQIRIAGPLYQPIIQTGSMISPGITTVVDASIVPCNPIDTPTSSPTATATVTHTPTPPIGSTATATATATRTPSGGPFSPTATPTSTRSPGVCVGDCNGDGMVSVADLIVGVNIALGNQPISNCPAFDVDGSGTVTIGELIQGVNNALNGCG